MQTNESTSTQNKPKQANTSLASQAPIVSKSVVRKPIINWLLIALLLGISSLFAYKYYELKQQIDNQQPTPSDLVAKVITISPSPALSPKPTTDPVADWKTYTNDKYNFSFKYPSGWDYREVSSKTQNTIDYLQVTLAKSEHFSPIPKGNPSVMISITETTDESKLSVYQITEVIKTIVIGGMTAEEREHKTPTVDSKYITFFRNNVAYEFESRMHSQDSEHQSIFDQILSTFKFTN